jgi:hypothetical protein
MSRLWDMGSSTQYSPLRQGFHPPPPRSPVLRCGFHPRVDTANRLAEGHVSRLAEGHVSRRAEGHVSPSCGRARILSCGRARVHACHKEAGPKAHRSAEGWSKARRAKRPIYCLCFCFLRFCPKKPCQAPKFPNPLPTKNIRLSYELPSNRYTGYRSKITALAFHASRAQPIENNYFSHNPLIMTILQMQNACNSLNKSGLS